jgi:hypothetical protein
LLKNYINASASAISSTLAKPSSIKTPATRENEGWFK